MSENRESMVQNAIGFLQDPSVQASPVASRIQFLEKKGLTRREIDEALRRVGLSRTGEGEGEGLKQMQGQLVPPSIPEKGPSENLKKLATSDSFSWKRIILYATLFSGAAATFNLTSLLDWIKFIFRRANYQISALLGLRPERPESPSVSIDRIGDLRHDISELRSEVKRVDERLNRELSSIKDSVKITYEKLEDDIEGLRLELQLQKSLQ